jgi:predicted DCC family thiol-disulfide oxidoreductase YuxK
MAASTPNHSYDRRVSQPTILYDGTCGLCSKSVQWILGHERDHDIQFAPLQGETAAKLRETHHAIPKTVESVVYVDGERVFLRSKAFLYVSRHLRSPWRWIYAFRWIPGFMLNGFYRFIAAIRYRVWGRVDACQIPAPEHRGRFLP